MAIIEIKAYKSHGKIFESHAKAVNHNLEVMLSKLARDYWFNNADSDIIVGFINQHKEDILKYYQIEMVKGV